MLAKVMFETAHDAVRIPLCPLAPDRIYSAPPPRTPEKVLPLTAPPKGIQPQVTPTACCMRVYLSSPLRISATPQLRNSATPRPRGPVISLLCCQGAASYACVVSIALARCHCVSHRNLVIRARPRRNTNTNMASPILRCPAARTSQSCLSYLAT